MECYNWFRICQALEIRLSFASPQTAPAEIILQSSTPMSYPLTISFVPKSCRKPNVRSHTAKELISAGGWSWNPNIIASEIVVDVKRGQYLLDAVRSLIQSVRCLD